MRMYHSLEGGCHAVIDEGFIEAFNDDHPGSTLQGLTGLTVRLDKDYNYIGWHFKNGDAKKWEGSHFMQLVEMVREEAKANGPRKASGVFPVVTVPPAPPKVEEAAPPVLRLVDSPKRESPYTYRQVSPTVVLRQRVGLGEYDGVLDHPFVFRYSEDVKQVRTVPKVDRFLHVGDPLS